MRLLLLTAISLSLVPNMAQAQTWQEWSKQNPTYPSMEKPAPQPSAPAAAPSTPAVNPSTPAAAPAAPTPSGADFSSFFPEVASTQDPAFATLFMKGCTYQGGPQAYCQCALTQMQNNFTFQELTTISRNARATGEFPEQLIDSILPCVSKLQ